jgi:hypothetical protein
MKLYTKITLLQKALCIFCIVFCCSLNSWSQQGDSTKIRLKSQSKKIGNIPEIKANIPTYKPKYSVGGSSMFNIISDTKTSSNVAVKEKSFSIVKIYPNPVDNQINIMLSLNKDAQVVYKIIDLLGNEVLTLANEHLSAGDQTRSFSIPNRLNPGIYFLRILAGGESQIKRISVL